MSEKAPTEQAMPEIVNNPEGLPPRDEAIDAVRNEISSLQTRMDEAEAKFAAPGAQATANDLIDARTQRDELRKTDGARLEALRGLWSEYGGDAIDKAQADVDNLNFRSDQSDRVDANYSLRDAKDAFYAKLQESMKEDEPAVEEAAKIEEDNRSEGEKNAAEIVEALKNNSELANNPEVMRKIAEIQETLSKPLSEEGAEKDNREVDSAWAGEDKKSADRETDTSWADKGEEKSHDDAESSTDAPKSGEGKKENTPAHHDEELLQDLINRDITRVYDDAHKENKKRNRKEWFGRVKNKDTRKEQLKDTFILSPSVKIWHGVTGIPERYKGMSRKSKLALAVGAIGVGLAIKYGTDIGWVPGGSGGDGSSKEVINNPSAIPSQHNPGDYYPNGNGPVGPDATPEIPTAKGYEYPWDWAQDVYGNDAMPKLHELGEEAAKHGYNVEWHGSGTHEWVEINGNSDSRDVITILRKFAK